nr:unnamed protein product [Microcystis aeruginosa PCC 7806]
MQILTDCIDRNR